MNEVAVKASNNLSIFNNAEAWGLATKMATSLAQSTIIPKDFQGNANNTLIAIELASRLQTSPLMVMQNLYVVYGRPSWSAQYIIAMINSSGRYDMELQFDEKPDSKGQPYSCMCWTEKNGRKVTGPIITMDLAKAEGWYDKNGSKWKTMPQMMLRYRAASFFGRMNCPDLMMGMYTREEQIEIGKEEYLENMAADVHKEIAQNANQTEFQPIAAIEEKPEPKTTIDVTAGKQENEAVKAEKKEQAMPAFMQTENT